MDFTSLYTNIPQDEGINTVCMAYEEFLQGNPHLPTRYLRELLSLILKENSFQFKTVMETKMATTFANIFMEKKEHKC